MYSSKDVLKYEINFEDRFSFCNENMKGQCSNEKKSIYLKMQNATLKLDINYRRTK